MNMFMQEYHQMTNVEHLSHLSDMTYLQSFLYSDTKDLKRGSNVMT